MYSSLLLVCAMALTGDWNHNLGVSGRCSNQLSYLGQGLPYLSLSHNYCSLDYRSHFKLFSLFLLLSPTIHFSLSSHNDHLKKKGKEKNISINMAQDLSYGMVYLRTTLHSPWKPLGIRRPKKQIKTKQQKVLNFHLQTYQKTERSYNHKWYIILPNAAKVWQSHLEG